MATISSPAAAQLSAASVSLGDAGKTKVQAIGVVKAVFGDAIAINASGVACVLKPGDKVFPNDIIQTNDQGSVQIEFVNGQKADMGRTTSLLLDDSIGLGKLFAAAEPVQPKPADDARIQKLLAEGADPSEILAPSAAGPTAAQGPAQDHQGHTFVQMEAVGSTSGVASLEGTLGSNTTIVSGNAIQSGVTVGLQTAAATPAPVTVATEPTTATTQTTTTTVADTTAPGKAAISIGSFVNDSTPTISGTSEAGATVNVVVRSTPQYFTVKADATGNWTIQIPEDGSHDLEDGQHTITVQVVDAAGNVGESIVVPFTVDTQYDTTSLAISTTGRVGDSTPTVTGTAEAGSTIRLTFSGTPTVLTATADANGNWSVESPVALNDGSYTILASATDQAGNTATKAAALTIDTTAPSTTVITPVANEDAGSPITVDATAPVTSTETVLTVIPPNPLPPGVSYDAAAQTFSLNPADSAFQNLAQGAIEFIPVTYTVSDGINNTTATINFEVIGVNDAPLAVAQVAATQEDGSTVSISALTGATDLDSGTTLSVIAPNVLPAGVTYDNATQSFVLDPANPAYNSLAAGATTTVVVTYGVSDGITTTSNTATFTVTGTNDAPVVTAAVTGNATEGGTGVTLNALASATDPDTGAALSVTNVSALPAGVTYDATSKTFTLDPSNSTYNSLAAGATTTVTVNYAVSDGITTTPASVSWTVSGTNDGALVAGTSLGAVTEAGGVDNTAAGTPSASGTLTASDADAGESGFATPANLSGAYGTFTFDTTTGAWTYTLDNTKSATQALSAGQTKTDTLTVTSLDGTASKTIAVTVTGTNDAPVVSGSVTGTATEGAAKSSLSALANASDVDATAALSVTNVGALPAGVTYNSTTKAFTLDPTNAAYNSLPAGATTTVTVNYQVSDGTVSTPASVSWTVTGTNDVAVITGTSTGAVTEAGGVNNATAGTPSASGTLTITDVDTGQKALAVPATLAGTYGNFTLNATTGAWTYTLDNTKSATQALTAGQKVTDSLTVTSLDGSASKAITVTVTGTISPASGSEKRHPC